MAKTTSRPNHGHHKAIHVFGFFCVMVLLVQKSGAIEFQVSWSVPTDSNAQSFNPWSQSRRFQIGDSLVFNYQANEDSVVQVTKEDYSNCNTDSPINKYTDGHTVFKFENSGPYYFISGNKDNCLKNEKLVVVVLADRANRSSNNTTLSPPTPSPAPSGEESPSPPSSPPAGMVEINPTPAPTSDEQPLSRPSGASSIIISLFVLVGAFSASSILLVF